MKLAIALKDNSEMIDSSTWDVVKTLIQFLVIPLVTGLAYFFKKAHVRLDKLEDDMTGTKTRVAVVESKIDDIREDIKDIKRGVEKLVERK
jgi:hypothetical protein